MRALPETPPTLFDNSFSNYDISLLVPDASKDVYMNTSPWNKFSQINGLSGGGEEKQKCATPIIVYQSGELTFSCETEGVEYVYDVKINDSKAGKGDKVQLMPKYSINVYATKADYEVSDVATMTIDLLSQSGNGIIGDTNGDGVVDAADVVKVTNIIMGK